MKASEMAAYFGVAPEILEFVPELLQDFSELGSNPELVVQWLREGGVAGPEHRVLDLGCGKGAVSVAVAEALGCQVDGIDALPAFVELARETTRNRGFDQLCRFAVGDIRATVDHAHDYDAVLLVSVGAFGSVEAMVGGCRRCVKLGGVIIIEDSYLTQPGCIDFPGYENLATRAGTLRQLSAHGDQILCERLTTLAEITEQNHKYNTWIKRRATELAVRHPKHAAAFRAYVERELEECHILETTVECATWMLRRTQ